MRLLRKAGANPHGQEANGVALRDLAQQLVVRFGERSTCVANFEALKARENGDGPAVSVWRWVAGATVEILRSEPEEESFAGAGGSLS